MNARLLLSAAALTASLGASASAPREKALVVFAAASLREPLTAMAEEFRARNPGVEVILNWAGSQQLRLQLEQGAAADVFASADTRNVEPLRRQGLVLPERLFARSAPILVVPKDNPAALRALADLPRARRVVLAAPEVPIGGYSQRILENAERRFGAGFVSRVQARVVSHELNVHQVLAKVALGEADAGIVYRTDLAAMGDRVEAIPIPPELNVQAEYVIAQLRRAPHPELARRWLELVFSPSGRAALARHGFEPAPAEAAR